MLLDIVTKGSTDRSVVLRIIDSGDGTPETGVVFNTSGIDLWYRREGAAKTSITEATLAALTTAHSDGGFLHVGDGYYRLDLPDAAFATGANYVDVGGTVTSMVVIGGRVRLIDTNLEDAVRGGMTALPNAAAEAAGGLYTRGTGAGQIAQDANDNIRANLDTIKTQTVTAAAGVTFPTSIASPTNITAGTITTVTNLTNAPTAGDLTATMKTSVTTAATAATPVAASVTGNVGGNVAGSVGSVTGNVGGNVTGSIGSLATQAKADVNAEVASVLDTHEGPDLPSGSVATDAGNSATSFKTDRTETTDSYWVDALIVLTSGAMAGQVKKVTAYNGTSKVITVSGGFTGTPADSVAFLLINR